MSELDKRETLGRRGGNAAAVVAAETLQEIQLLRQTMTDFAAQLAGRMVNKVLTVETRAFPADGSPLTWQFQVAAGAIEVQPLGTNAVTVDASGPSSAGPVVGVGVSVVQPNVGPRTVALASRQVTLYGTAGDRVSVQVFAGAIQPSS